MSATQTSVDSMESFASLFAESLERQEMRAGEVITAEVVRIDSNHVVVNAGLKSESFIDVAEFKNDRGEVEVNVGDYVSVAIEMLEDGYGETRLSRDKAKRIAAWNDLDKALTDEVLVKGMITGKVKGGLTVMVNGIRAFLPGSLVDTRPVKDTTPFEGKEFEFKVIKLDRKRNNVVVSRRAVLEASQGEERQALLENLKEGTVVKGIVKNITDYGAFVDLGGIDGLLHIKVVQLGDEVEVMILEIDEERRRISLGMKQCQANPWDDFAVNHKKGDKVRGAIKSITDFGIFIGLPGNIDGLVHLSDLSWSAAGEEAKQNFKKGDEVEAIVLSIDVEKERISLGIKQMDGDPFTSFIAMHDKNSIVTGTVTTIDAKGAVVKLGDDVEGYLRASEAARERVEDLRTIYKEGDTVEALIINVDRKTRSINLSIKAKDQVEQNEAMGKLSADVTSANSGTTNLGALLKAKLSQQ
jgi:small subunit ribosomal protein S1